MGWKKLVNVLFYWVVILCYVYKGHARARDEEVVSASQVYFLPFPPRYPPPGQPPALSLRHIVDKVRKS